MKEKERKGGKGKEERKEGGKEEEKMRRIKKSPTAGSNP